MSDWWSPVFACLTLLLMSGGQSEQRKNFYFISTRNSFQSYWVCQVSSPAWNKSINVSKAGTVIVLLFCLQLLKPRRVIIAGRKTIQPSIKLNYSCWTLHIWPNLHSNKRWKFYSDSSIRCKWRESLLHFRKSLRRITVTNPLLSTMVGLVLLYVLNYLCFSQQNWFHSNPGDVRLYLTVSSNNASFANTFQFFQLFSQKP